jgi:hypothetical protein
LEVVVVVEEVWQQRHPHREGLRLGLADRRDELEVVPAGLGREVRQRQHFH